MTKEPKCEHCVYFDPFMNKPDSAGLCRVDPPKLIAETTAGVWPTVKHIEWCGKFSDEWPVRTSINEWPGESSVVISYEQAKKLIENDDS
jgi:hypothetical protein